MSPKEQLAALLSPPHPVDIVSEEELLAKLERGQPLRIKYGADPSAPDLHLGHSVPISRLRKFQELGHTIVFIIGDFTARIGDPSGKSKTRPMLTTEQVDANARTYAAQVGKLLDISKCELHYNSEWLDPMTVADVLRLMSHYTVARMLERDDFAKRLREETPISVVELMYPLMQAYDSVAIKADVELGGTDQLFNFLVGRDIMRAYGQEPQVVMTWPLLVGTDGTEKMSKSLGNYVGITDAPGDMFGKLMSIPDDAMGMYYWLLLEQAAATVEAMEADLKSGALHPREAKVALAKSIVTTYHSAAAADEAAAEFDRIFAQGELPSDMPDLAVPAGELEDGAIGLIKLLVLAGFASSNGEARRLIRGKGVKVEGEVIEDEMAVVPLQGGEVVQVGKRRVGRVVIA
ncbi:MAG: tyrosine--tRNA ligase [Armatimonadetes bacterium]|nr:tyrosine--tRNA ligase [Armatimonadota bacterium]